MLYTNRFYYRIVLKKGVIYLDQHTILNFGNETKNKS